MKQSLLTSALLCLSLGLVAPFASAGDCTKCDCIHLPCPEECKPCCGFKRGKITFQGDKTFLMDGQRFKLSADTKISGNITDGSEAKVYFRISKDENEVTKIVVVQPKGAGTAGPH